MHIFAALFALTVSGPFVSDAAACGGDCSGTCPMKAQQAAGSETERVLAADGTKLELAVSGVHCLMTAAQVKGALLQVDGVADVAVETSGKTTVAFDEGKTSQDALIAAVNAVSGFQAQVAES